MFERASARRGVILVSKYQKFAMLRHDLLIGFCTGNSIWCQRGSSISARCEIEGRKRGSGGLGRGGGGGAEAGAI